MGQGQFGRSLKKCLELKRVYLQVWPASGGITAHGTVKPHTNEMPQQIPETKKQKDVKRLPCRRTSAVMSLLETSRLNGVDPYGWLKSVLERLSEWTKERQHELLLPFVKNPLNS